MHISSDEFELKFSGSGRAERVPSRAELGHFNFRAETELTKSSKILTLIINFTQIFQFCAFTIIITSKSDQIQDHLYKSTSKKRHFLCWTLWFSYSLWNFGSFSANFGFRAEVKKVTSLQLELWFEPARLGLITNFYPQKNIMISLKRLIFNNNCLP